MADKFLQLVVQIAICLALLWLVKGMSGRFGIAYIIVAYILSYILTKALFYCINQRKARGGEGEK